MLCGKGNLDQKWIESKIHSIKDLSQFGLQKVSITRFSYFSILVSMTATDTNTVKITQIDEDSGLGVILYVSNLVGVSGESLTTTSIDNLLKETVQYNVGGASFKELRSDITRLLLKLS
jgi:hypothetical protein